MYNVETQTIRLMGKEEKVIRYDCWMMTPFGLTDNLEEAIEKVKQLDMLPELTIRFVVVAISDSYYEVVSR